MPTHRNSRLFATAWKTTKKIAAQIASGVPTPAQAVIRPRLAIVEYASTRLALLCEMAKNEQNRKVRPPTMTTMPDAIGKTRNSGDSLISRNTPAFTIVEECSRALVGVGATMAPRSHVWNGIWAALVMPAKASSTTGTANRAAAAVPADMAPAMRNSLNTSGNPLSAANAMATWNATPPSMFITIWRNALLMASSVLVKPMSRNEHSVVTSHAV